MRAGPRFPHEHWRRYQLLQLGVPLGEQDDWPAVELDWLLAIGESVRKVEAEKAQAAAARR